MESWDKRYPDRDSLKECLRAARNAGWYRTIGKEGKTRAELIAPLLSAITGEEREWTADQCAVFFEKLLCKYCEADKLELMLAVSGYGDEYHNRERAAKRRVRFFDLVVNNEASSITRPDSLAKCEDRALQDISEKMWEDYSSGKLRQFARSLFDENFIDDETALITIAEPNDELAPKFESAAEPISVSEPGTESESEAEQKPITKRKVIRWASVLVGAAAFLAAVVIFPIQNAGTPSETTGENAPYEGENITYDLSYEDGDDAGTLWGDSDGGRLTYTKSEVNAGVLEDRITFNSLTDGELGDERNFVGAALVNGQSSVWHGSDIEVEDGQTYVICLYVHNDNPDGLNAIAEDVRVRFELPITVSKIHEVTGYIESSNSEPDQYWDGVTLYSAEEFYLEYVEGSAIYQNDGMGTICITDDIITNGAPIGYDRFDGKLPGGHGYEGIVAIKVVAHASVTMRLSLAARLQGTFYWPEAVYANIGDEVEFQITYRNLASGTGTDIMIRDILPDNMEYVSGSTVLYNSNYQDGVSVIDDTVATEGINIGSYASTGNAYVRFSAKVVDNNLTDGLNQLVNWASATVDNEVYKDDASILVTKK